MLAKNAAVSAVLLDNYDDFDSGHYLLDSTRSLRTTNDATVWNVG